ncbi:conjugative transposon protein TraN [Pontibacter actiniarum]|uniref:Conjugative transposon protein TraN n=1 Tax=Pontibacter actiniarum TaxID=323450 RepID=A0A1X9YSD0_9BACT|nr:conjugative transposon protein TraN [Pontibacter actiniarum]ARS35734.1 conjugative transposon protein TraN [Pontibacter actiniarum]
MKKNNFLLAFLWLLTASQAFSQTGLRAVRGTALPVCQLTVSPNKTTHLVFPFAVQSVDRGSGDILVQQAAPAENMLRVKAASAGFRQTSLTVLTADGSLYTFVVSYAPEPGALSLQLPRLPLSAAPVAFLPGKANRAVLERDAACVAATAGGKHRTARSGGMRLQVGQFHIRGEVLYCQFRIRNSTSTRYNLDQFRFYVRDRQGRRRTASQELELKPLYIHGAGAVEGHTERVLVVALPKVTLPDKKYLVVELMERNGGRHLQLKLSSRLLLQAKAFDQVD